jgi:thiosulfate/3-mercaptopyruvate sulfurtransferase
MKTTLVTVTELTQHLDDAAWRVFDCRSSLTDSAAGRRAYLESHIPGAVHADVGEELSAPHVPGATGRHPLPSRNEWIARALRWGLTPDVQVVLYDDAGGVFAARMWWMLRWIGHAAVAVLDGGWQDWLSRGTGVTHELPEPVPAASADYANRPPLSRLIEASAVDGAAYLLLDAREPKRFRGEWEPLDPVAGHIPGARCSPSGSNLDAAGFFKPRAALRRKFAAAIGDRSGADVVCYCGSGITAAHNVLAMVHADLEEPLLYAGSWSEWITDPDRAIAVGE